MNPPSQKPQHRQLANFDPVAEIYDDTREKLSEREFRSLKNTLDGSKTLEIAVGTGRLAKPLQDQGIDLTGIDVSTRMLARAKAKQARNLVRGEVTHLPFRDEAFDTVLAVHFLHLVPDWPALLGEVTRVARYRFVSVDTRTDPKARRPRELYLEKLDQRGFPAPINPSELILAERIRPARMELIEKGVEPGNMNKMLDMLDKRWLAVTWTVPDQLHREVMDELKRELSGKSVDFAYETFLLVWNVEDITSKLPYL